MKTWLFNPFKYIAGGKALLLGMGAVLVTAILSMALTVHLDGVIDLHLGRVSPSYIYFIEPLIDWICLLIPLYIFGKSFSVSHVRLVDMAGTSALARYPMFFAVLVSMLSPQNIGDPNSFIQQLQTDPALIVHLVITGLFLIPFIVWTVALLYNAYAVSAHLKGPKATWSFIASLFIGEVLSKILLSYLY